jgi:hypothetical protein
MPPLMFCLKLNVRGVLAEHIVDLAWYGEQDDPRSFVHANECKIYSFLFSFKPDISHQDSKIISIHVSLITNNCIDV